MIKVAGKVVELQDIGRDFPRGGVESMIIQKIWGAEESFEYSSIDELRFEVELRKSTIEAAVELNSSGMGFAIFEKSRCNTDYWKRSPDGGFVLKSNVRPSDAIRDIYKNGSLYATECATAIMIVFYKAVLTLYPDALYDKVFSNITLMNWHHIDPVFGSIGLMKNTKDFLPGDRGYFINPDVDPLTPHWQGENVIILGGGSYYGHGIGIKNAEAIIEALNQNRARGSNKSAYMLKKVGRVNYRKLFRTAKSYH